MSVTPLSCFLSSSNQTHREEERKDPDITYSFQISENIKVIGDRFGKVSCLLKSSTTATSSSSLLFSFDGKVGPISGVSVLCYNNNSNDNNNNNFPSIVAVHGIGEPCANVFIISYSALSNNNPQSKSGKNKNKNALTNTKKSNNNTTATLRWKCTNHVLGISTLSLISGSVHPLLLTCGKDGGIRLFDLNSSFSSNSHTSMIQPKYTIFAPEETPIPVAIIIPSSTSNNNNSFNVTSNLMIWCEKNINNNEEDEEQKINEENKNKFLTLSEYFSNSSIIEIDLLSTQRVSQGLVAGNLQPGQTLCSMEIVSKMNVKEFFYRSTSNKNVSSSSSSSFWTSNNNKEVVNLSVMFDGLARTMYFSVFFNNTNDNTEKEKESSSSSCQKNFLVDFKKGNQAEEISSFSEANIRNNNNNNSFLNVISWKVSSSSETSEKLIFQKRTTTSDRKFLNNTSALTLQSVFESAIFENQSTKARFRRGRQEQEEQKEEENIPSSKIMIDGTTGMKMTKKETEISEVTERCVQLQELIQQLKSKN